MFTRLLVFLTILFMSTNLMAGGIARQSFEIPENPNPETDQRGEIALDNQVAFHNPLLQYYDGDENLMIPAFPTADLTTTDNDILYYDAANDKFTWGSATTALADVYLLNSGDATTGDIDFNDGVGDSPKATFTPASGTAWSIYTEDAADDLQIYTNTSTVEWVDIFNAGSGEANLSVESELKVSGSNCGLADGAFWHSGSDGNVQCDEDLYFDTNTFRVSIFGGVPAYTLDVGGDIYTDGDVRVNGDDIFMATNTSGHLLVADGTNFNPVAMSGDATIDSTGVVTVNASSSSKWTDAGATTYLTSTTDDLAVGGTDDTSPIFIDVSDEVKLGVTLDYNGNNVRDDTYDIDGASATYTTPTYHLYDTVANLGGYTSQGWADELSIKTQSGALSGGVGLSDALWNPYTQLMCAADNNAEAMRCYYPDDWALAKVITFDTGTGFDDTEATELLYCTGSMTASNLTCTYVVAEEGTNELTFFEIDETAGNVTIDQTDWTSYVAKTSGGADIWTPSVGNGMESVTYNARENKVYVAKQMSSLEFFKCTPGTQNSCTEPFDAATVWSGTVTELNSMSYSYSTDTVFAISNTDDLIFEFDHMDGTILKTYDYSSLGLDAEFTQEEGVAITWDGLHLFMTSEADGGAWLSRIPDAPHADGANCAAGEIPLGVDADGAVQGCYEPTEADISDLDHTATAITDGIIVEADLDEDSGTPTDEDVLTYDSTGANFNWVAQSTLAAGTATALAANGANCAAGEIALGVDASGAVEGCYEPTEADISDLSHTVDTNANTICTGTDVYLDGEGNCDTITSDTDTKLIDADSDTQVQVEEGADDDNIRFDTAGTERMVIDEVGDIGVGTDSPEGQLANTADDGGTWNVADDALIWRSDSNGYVANFVNRSGASSDSVMRLHTEGTGSSDVLLLMSSGATNGTTRAAFLGDGTVGFGDSSPDNYVDLEFSEAGTVGITPSTWKGFEVNNTSGTSDDGAGIHLLSGSFDVGILAVTDGTTSDGRLSIYGESAVGGVDEWLTGWTQKWGIMDTTPDAMLEIVSFYDPFMISATEGGDGDYMKVDTSGNLVLGQYDCSGNANGGVLTADASGNVTCTDDDSGAADQNLFETINATSGTDPVADSATDTLNLSAGTGITVTGDSSTDTITIATTVTDTDTNANTECSGTTTYLDGEGNCDDISSVYEPAGITESDISDLNHTATAITDDIVDYPDIKQSNTLAGNITTLADECFFVATASGGGFICEGSTADTSEQLYLFPDVNGADTTQEITINDATQTLTNKTINTASNTITVVEADISDLSHTVDTNLTQEEVEDYAGGMVTGNTETLITVTYQDGDGTVDYVVDSSLSNYTNDAGFLTSEVDGSTTNEIQNLFQTFNASSGTDPVADSSTDTLNITAGTGMTVTGDSGTDTITIATTVTDTDTNANTECSGSTTYLDGDGNCDDISSVYEPAFGDIYLLNTGDTATGDYTFDSGTLFIDSSANEVGIGTSAPDSALEIEANSARALSVDSNYTSGNHWLLRMDTNGANFSGFYDVSDDVYLYLRDNGANVDILLKPDADSYITDQLGIGGEQSPEAELEISDASSVGAHIYLQDSTSFSHSMTALAPANVFGTLGHHSDNYDGLLIEGFSSSGYGNRVPVAVDCYFGNASNQYDFPCFEIKAAERSGTSGTTLSDAKPAFGVANNNSVSMFTVWGSGSAGLGDFETGNYAPTGSNTSAFIFGDNGGDVTLGSNMAAIYAKDNGGTVEMYAQDEAGNVSILSPHDPVTNDWIFLSHNVKTGRTVRVNMERMIRKLEAFTGESFIEESYRNGE